MKYEYLVMTDGSVINAKHITSTKYFGESNRWYVYLSTGVMHSDRAHSITKEDFDLIRENFEDKNEDRTTTEDR